MQADGMRRRDVLRSAGVLATTLVAGKTVIFGPGHAWAMAPTSLDPHAAQTLMVMAYDLFPHESLGSEYYAAVVVSLDKEAAGDPALRTLLTNGVAKLDASHGMPWIELSEGQRVAVLKGIETSEFFTTMRTKTINALYGNPLVYQTFGYGGPSVEHGGYIDRGFDDIGWLPKS